MKSLPSIKTLIKPFSQLQQNGVDLIEWSSPIPVFGDILNAEIATLGLNPSNREFVNANGTELTGEERRFPTLYSLGIKKWEDASQKEFEIIEESCSSYFENNPYDRWFKILDDLLSGVSSSYYKGMPKVACHLDLVPFTTSKKWSELNNTQQKSLLNYSESFFLSLLENSNINTLILNGQTVVDSFCHSTKLKLNKTMKPAWSLARKSGNNVKGYSYFGLTDKIGSKKIDRQIMILGYNHNLQSSFGVSKEVKYSINNWISEQYINPNNEQ